MVHHPVALVLSCASSLHCSSPWAFSVLLSLEFQAAFDNFCSLKEEEVIYSVTCGALMPFRVEGRHPDTSYPVLRSSTYLMKLMGL